MNREWTLRWLILACLTLTVASFPLVADDSSTTQVNWSIASTQTLSIAGSDNPGGRRVASTFRLPEPTDADLARGHIDRDDALRLNAHSNIDWIVTARSESATLGTSHDETLTKPIGDLQLRADGGDYRPLSTDERIIARGNAGRETVRVDYRVDLDPNAYRPGHYQATVIYTISTP